MFNQLLKIAKDTEIPAGKNSPLLYTNKYQKRLTMGTLFSAIKAMSQFTYVPTDKELYKDLGAMLPEGGEQKGSFENRGFFNEKIEDEIIREVIKNHFDEMIGLLGVSKSDGGKTLGGTKLNIVQTAGDADIVKGMAALVRRYMMELGNPKCKFINDPTNPKSYKVGDDTELRYINHTADDVKFLDANKSQLLGSTENLDVSKFFAIQTFKEFVEVFVDISDDPMFSKLMKLLDSRSLSFNYANKGKIVTEYFANLPILQHIKNSTGKFTKVGTYLIDSIIKYAQAILGEDIKSLADVKARLPEFMKKFDEMEYRDFFNSSAIRTVIKRRRVSVGASPIPEKNPAEATGDQKELKDPTGISAENPWDDPEWVKEMIENDEVDKIVVDIMNKTVGYTAGSIAKKINEAVGIDLSARDAHASAFKSTLWSKLQEFIKLNKKEAGRIFTKAGNLEQQFNDLYTQIGIAALKLHKQGHLLNEILEGTSKTQIESVIDSVTDLIVAAVSPSPLKDWGEIRPMIRSAFANLYLVRVQKPLEEKNLIEDNTIDALAKTLVDKLPIDLAKEDNADMILEVVANRLKATGYSSQVSNVVGKLRVEFNKLSGSKRLLPKVKEQPEPKAQAPKQEEPKKQKSK